MVTIGSSVDAHPIAKQVAEDLLGMGPAPSTAKGRGRGDGVGGVRGGGGGGARGRAEADARLRKRAGLVRIRNLFMAVHKQCPLHPPPFLSLEVLAAEAIWHNALICNRRGRHDG